MLANLSLGELVAYVDPEVYFDPKGDIHIMQPIAMSTYLYSRADAAGKVLHQGIFKTFQTVPPRLTKLEDGNVVVVGGLEENPNAPPRNPFPRPEKSQRRGAEGSQFSLGVAGGRSRLDSLTPFVLRSADRFILTRGSSLPDSPPNPKPCSIYSR